MSAPQAPVQEPVVATPEPEQAPSIAEPAVPASPEVSQEAGEAQEGSQDTGTGIDLKELLKDASPEELRAVLDAAPAERREAALAEDLRRAEQRGVTRATEELQARTQRQDYYSEGIVQGQQAAQWLSNVAQNLPMMTRGVAQALDLGDEGEAKQRLGAMQQIPQGIHAALQDARNGAVLEAGQRASGQLNQYISSKSDLLGRLEDGEVKALEKLAYEDGRTGANRTQMALFDLLLQRAEARGIEKGVQKGVKDKELTVKTGELAARIAEAKKDAPVRVTKGAGDTSVANNDAARKQRLAYGGATDEDRAWLQDYSSRF